MTKCQCKRRASRNFCWPFSCIDCLLCGILILRDLRGRVQFPTGGEVYVRGTYAKPASLHGVAKRCMDRIRCDSEADSIVWMGEGLNGDRCVLLPMRNRAIGAYFVFTDDFSVPPLHASRMLVELMVFSALLQK